MPREALRRVHVLTHFKDGRFKNNPQEQKESKQGYTIANFLYPVLTMR